MTDDRVLVEPPTCPACHHREHDPGSCPECPRCELHFDEAVAWLARNGQFPAARASTAGGGLLNELAALTPITAKNGEVIGFALPEWLLLRLRAALSESDEDAGLELRALSDAATPGEWYQRRDGTVGTTKPHHRLRWTNENVALSIAAVNYVRARIKESTRAQKESQTDDWREQAATDGELNNEEPIR